MAIGNPQDIKGTQALRNSAHAAHGVVISVAVIIWFPLGVFLLRLLKRPNTVRFHSLWQSFGLFLLVIGFGLGAWLSNLQGDLYKEGHVILGIVITLLFLLQPVIGWLHHRHFAANGTKNYKRHTHVWLGRVLLVLSLINGGTGLKLSDNTTAGGIVYGIIAGLMAIAYIGLWWWSKKYSKVEGETQGEKSEATDNAVAQTT